jgi:hypothetical protein
MPQAVPTTFTQEALGELRRKSTTTLRHWRNRGTGPVWFRTAGRIVYSAEAVERWLQAQARGAVHPPVLVEQPFRRPRRRPYSGIE